jgi:Fe-S-cluster-containing hydrogenase component 2
MEMADIKRAVQEDAPSESQFAQISEYIRTIVTRREFLQYSGVAGMGVATFYLVGCGSSSTSDSTTPRQVFVANSQGMIVAEPTLCVGCRRCEAACVAYNQGKAQPAISNVKVNRNYLFGVTGIQQGFVRGDGIYGDFRIVQDACRQCPHPVPCQLACPHGAIEVVPPVDARVVNIDKCVGCGICVMACPWAMTSLDGPVNGANTKANKCHLCKGNPECVPACPAGALKYVAWEDRTKVVPPRQIVPASIQLAADVKDTCNKCH